MHRNRTAGGIAALAAMIMVAGAGTLSAAAPPASARPGHPLLQTVPLSLLGGRSARSAGTAVLLPRATEPFSLLGVTWSDPAAALHAAVQVRVRAAGTGRWGAWHTLESDGSAAGDRRGSTDPLWVGESDGVQARVVGARAGLPAGLRVDLINTDPPVTSTGPSGDRDASAGRSSTLPADPEPAAGRDEAVPADPAPVAAEAVPQGRSAAGTVPLPTRPVPRMITRAGWGANEAIVKGAPQYTGPVKVFFVHHTATGNDYRCADSASIVRGIQAYQVRSKGWNDIGYNFLVDKCGTVFEGRAGGVGRSVLGAHTLGFNTDASAIAAIGTYDTVRVPTATRNAIAAVAAYKLGAFGNPPSGRVTLTSGGSDRYPQGTRVVLYRISGHRDTGQTDCPGDALYAQLPQIRAIAGAAPAGLRLLRLTGAVRHGSLLFTRGVVKPLWDLTTPSAFINRFEIWVDGRLTVAAPGSHRTAAIRLTPGGHTVTIRAEHLSGRVASITAKVVADDRAPVFTAGPEVALRTGSLATSVPIRLGWAAADVNGLAEVRLLKPTVVDLGTVAHSRIGTLRPGVPATFVVQAVDRAGNAASASVTRTPVIVSEAAAQLTGTWRTLRNPAYLGGVAAGSVAGGASATWTFTGRSAALVFGRGAASGRVRVVVDGRDQGLVDLRSTTTVYRQAVWSGSWPASGSHTVRVELEGTTGRPGAVLDGFVYLT